MTLTSEQLEPVDLLEPVDTVCVYCIIYLCIYILTCVPVMYRNRFMSSFSGGNPHATSTNNANSLIESFPLTRLVIRVCGRAFSDGVRFRAPINYSC